MGSTGGIGTWGCGRPAVAAWYAYQDAQVDHWGEGVYGEIFFSALESIAFGGGEIESLTRKALTFITPDCKVHQAVAFVLDAEPAASVEDVRNQVLKRFGHHNFTDCVQNIAFTILGLLRGGDDLLDVTRCAGPSSGPRTARRPGPFRSRRSCRASTHRRSARRCSRTAACSSSPTTACTARSCG